MGTTMPPIKPGCHNFNLTLRVPEGEETEYVDKFFEDHQAFMRSTHGNPSKEPFCLMYIVTKTPESKEDGSTTGNNLYALTETYQGTEGCDAHMSAGKNYQKKEGEDHGALFGTFLDIVSKYAIASVMAAEVVRTMSDPLLGAMDAVKAGCRAFNLSFKVPDEETSEVDAFFEAHKAFMDETHPVDFCDEEPMVLFYTVTKTPELADPAGDPSKGTTGNTLYALTEIYRGLEGCEAHMAAGKNYQKKEDEDHGALFGTFLSVVEKYASATSMMAPVIAAMHD